MKIQIKNRLDGSIIFECEADSVKVVAKLALESGANLSSADLSSANLSSANPGPTCPGPPCPGPTCPGPTLIFRAGRYGAGAKRLKWICGWFINLSRISASWIATIKFSNRCGNP